MPNFKRLVAQVHDIEADSGAQADEIARTIADATNIALRVRGLASAWAPMVSDGASGGDELMDILSDCYVRDEVDDDPERVPRGGYVDVGETVVPERLMAWRDARVKAALDAVIAEMHASPMWATAPNYGEAMAAADWFAGIIRAHAAKAVS